MTSFKKNPIQVPEPLPQKPEIPTSIRVRTASGESVIISAATSEYRSDGKISFFLNGVNVASFAGGSWQYFVVQESEVKP